VLNWDDATSTVILSDAAIQNLLPSSDNNGKLSITDGRIKRLYWLSHRFT
jgi:hypothetical protein